MASSRLRPSPARERWVLAAGLAAALALGVAALKVLPDPDAAGSAEVARASADVASLLQERWASQRRRLDGLVPLRDDLVLPAEPDPSPAAPLSLAKSSPSDVFETLLAESARLEQRDETLPEAVRAIEEAVTAAKDESSLARALLRKIQLCAKAEDAEGARAAWDRASQEWSPKVAWNGTSFLLQCATAAAPLLNEGERALAQNTLAQAFAQGALPLPREPELGAEGFPRESTLAAFWIAELEDLSTNPGGRGSVRLGRMRRDALALQAQRSLPTADAPKEWAIDFEEAPVLAQWRDARGVSTVRFVDLAATQSLALEEAALPEGFEVAFDGAKLETVPVRDRRLLAGSPLGFRIGHEAPDRLREGQAQRVRFGRLGLLGLALALLLASVATARMLRRERRLAELKTRFIAGISHDLRTPLASILLMAENLEDGRIRDEAGQARYYRAIRGEADRLRRLVDDVLDFSRIERGEGTKLKLEDTDLKAFAEELEAELSARVERGGGQLDVETRGLDHGCTLDRDAVRRALWNLVDNAITHGGGDKIRLSFEGSADSLTLEVEDSGPGIPSSERERIFEAFRQGQAPGAEHAGGTGLGLAIVREIARAHGGRVVALDASRESGALFRITLPQDSADSPPRSNNES